MESLLNKLFVRIVIGISIGIPFTVVSIVLGFHGLVLLYAGVKDLALLPFLLGIVTITGFIGIIGAWFRLLIPSNEMGAKSSKRIRLMLTSGLLTSLSFFLLAVYKSEMESSVFMLALTLGASAFVYATPRKI